MASIAIITALPVCAVGRDRREAYSEHDDLWHTLRVLWLVLIRDEPVKSFGDKPLASALGLPVLNGELFAPQDLDECSISNRNLLTAFLESVVVSGKQDGSATGASIMPLSMSRNSVPFTKVCWNFIPPWIAIRRAARHFSLLFGSDRKTTGFLLHTAGIGRRIDSLSVGAGDTGSAENSGRESVKMLSFQSESVIRHAVSGHFLLAAARAIGKELARLRTGDDEPAPEHVRAAIRDAISHCIYGVDKNPLAVDLCRVALWLEGHTADKPLTFLDHRIRLRRFVGRRCSTWTC